MISIDVISSVDVKYKNLFDGLHSFLLKMNIECNTILCNVKYLVLNGNFDAVSSTFLSKESMVSKMETANSGAYFMMWRNN